MYACTVRGVFLENTKFLRQVYVDDLSRKHESDYKVFSTEPVWWVLGI